MTSTPVPSADCAVVIVNYCSADDTLRCARAATRAASVTRVIVVDNASTDNSVAELKRSAGLTVLVRDHNDGFAAGVNAGFAATDEPFVLLLNPDTEPEDDALELLLSDLRARPDVGVAAPRLIYPDGSIQPSTYRRFPGPLTIFADLSVPVGYALEMLGPTRHPLHARPDDRAPAHVIGAALAIRRSAYRAAGPFDEGFFLYLEETEWQQRLRRAGWRVSWVPEAVVVHHVRGGGDAALAPSLHYARSAVRYLRGQGHGRTVSWASVAGGILSSRVGLRLIALLPAKREVSLRKARAYDALWQHIRRARAAR